MVEVAMSLAIVAFALVAIMGVMPTGLNVQRQNREETVIAQDGAFILEAIRQGAMATNLSVLSNNLVFLEKTSLHAIGSTRTDYWTNNPTIAPISTGELLLQLSRPRAVETYRQTLIPLVDPYVLTNRVRARFNAFGGNMTALLSGSTLDRFQYDVTFDIVRVTNSLATVTNFASTFMAGNLYSVKLTFRWPVLPNGNLGLGEKVMMTQINGRLQPMVYNTNVTYSALNTNSQAQFDRVGNGERSVGYIFQNSFGR